VDQVATLTDVSALIWHEKLKRGQMPVNRSPLGETPADWDLAEPGLLTLI
jgi:hypothetical protein